MASLFQTFTPDNNEPPRRRFRPVPLRLLIPNLITLLALCAGLSAMRMALEGKFDFAVYLVLLAAILDSMDGRIARLMKGTSKFGAELDSLADFVSFGAGPALILYLWGMHQAGPIGWIAVLVFSICGALRLARFNVQIEDPNAPLVITGDALHSPIQCLRPDWNFAYDHDKPLAARSRRALLDAAEEANQTMLGSHFPLPSLGHVTNAGDAFCWHGR